MSAKPPYRCVVLDAPWAEYGGGGRGAQNHYPLMGLSDIAKTVSRADKFLVASDAHLWCWVTDNFLQDGLSLIEQLGFTYKRTFCWVKLDGDEIGELAEHDTAIIVAERALQIGLGQYARGAHELCLFATRGNAMVPAPEHRPPSVLFAPRREHSRKPDECFRDWFTSVSPGPYLEMFAREPRPGWDAWGLETGKFTDSRSAATTALDRGATGSPDPRGAAVQQSPSLMGNEEAVADA